MIKTKFSTLPTIKSLLLPSLIIYAPLSFAAEALEEAERPDKYKNQQSSNIQTIQLEEIVVSGDKITPSATLANTVRQQSPNAKVVIEAEQLNQFGDQPLGDALRRLPGVTFPGGNRARDVQFRAVGAEYTQIFLNGRPLIDGASSRSVQVDRIPSSLVQRVEVIRSPLASQDGQGVAGTLNIVLKNQDYTPRNQVGLGAGYLEQNGEVGDTTFLTAGEAGILKYAISGGVQKQRRNESKNTLTFAGTGAANRGQLGVNERSFEQFNLVPSFMLMLGDHDNLKIEPSYLRTEEDRFDQTSRLTVNQQTVDQVEKEDRNRVRENFGLFTAWDHAFSADTTMTVSLDTQKAREDTARDANRFNAAGVLNRTRQRSEAIDLFRLNPKIQFEHLADTHKVLWGADYSRFTRKEGNGEVLNGVVQAFNPTRAYQVEESRLNVFIQDQWRISERLRLTSGMRLEDSQTETRDALATKNQQDNLFWLPNVQTVYAMTPTTDIRLGVAKTLRRPDLRELTPTVTLAAGGGAGTFSNPDIGGNPEVSPESVWGVDAGLDQYFMQGSGVVSVNMFNRKFKDKIEYVTQLESGRAVSRPRNAGDGRLIGIEVDARSSLQFIHLPNVTVWANYAHANTELDASTGERRRFADQNDYVANIGLDIFAPAIKTTFGLSANHVSGYDQTIRLANGGATRSKVANTTRVDFSSRTQLSKKLALNISALNIFAQTEKRLDQTLDSAGAISAYTLTNEPTYRGFYARLTMDF